VVPLEPYNLFFFLMWAFVAAVTCVVTTESMLESEKVRQDLEFAK
jgi:hypothetical protein